MQYKSLLCTFLATATWCNGQVPVPLSLPGHSILCICCRDGVPAYPCVQKTENTTKQYGLADFGAHLYVLYKSVYTVYGFTVDFSSLFLPLMLNKNDKFDTTSILIEFDLSNWGCISNVFR